MNKHIKKRDGVFYTNKANPFNHKHFLDWAHNIGLEKETILEPFAGANHIIDALQDMGVCRDFMSFDITPAHKSVRKRDTISNFPTKYRFCVTNPPWLYKSRAKRMKLSYPDTKWDNLYKHCLDLCLQNCDYVAIVIPASFLSSNIFLDRLYSIIFIQNLLFSDTENPVCLAIFNKEKVKDTTIFMDSKKIGMLSQMQKHIPQGSDAEVVFNKADGELGLIAIDNTKGPSIRFCKGSDLAGYTVGHSSRSITRISMHDDICVSNSLITQFNKTLNSFRDKTDDIFMTAFKGLRADGKYRRRLDYSLARKIITENL